jgi:hypothetical protein
MDETVESAAVEWGLDVRNWSQHQYLLSAPVAGLQGCLLLEQLSLSQLLQSLL